MQIQVNQMNYITINQCIKNKNRKKKRRHIKNKRPTKDLKLLKTRKVRK